MSKVFGGYDPKIFINGVNNDFVCTICSCIVRKPKECNGCGSLFCESCLKLWVEKNSKTLTIKFTLLILIL